MRLEQLSAVPNKNFIEPCEREYHQHDWLPFRYAEQFDDHLPETGAGFNDIILDAEVCDMLGIHRESSFGYAEFLVASGYLSIGTMHYEECREGDWDNSFSESHSLRLKANCWEVASK